MLRINKFVSKNYLRVCKKWFDYIPDFWNIELVLEKKASELTEQELIILKLIKECERLSKIIDKYLSMTETTTELDDLSDLCSLNLTSEEIKELNDTLDCFKIDTFAKLKLSEEELRFIDDIINRYDGTNKQDILNVINKEENEYTREYANYCLSKQIARYEIQKSNRLKERPIGYKLRNQKNQSHRKKY